MKLLFDYRLFAVLLLATPLGHGVAAQPFDTSWTELVRPSPTSDAQFGRNIVVDGPLAALGSEGAQRVDLFLETEGVWQWHATISAPSDQGATDGFGASIAFTPTKLVIAARAANNAQGRLFIYRRLADQRFEFAQTVESPELIGKRMGTSLLAHGETLIAGAPFAGGAVYVFRPHESLGRYDNLNNAAVLRPTIGVDLGRGIAVQGELLLTGESGNQVTLFDLSTFPPRPAGIIPRPGSVQDEFGHTIAAADDYLVIGARSFEGSRGAAYIFVDPMDPPLSLIGRAGVPALFGIAAAVRGQRFAVAANGEGSSHAGVPAQRGYVRIYQRDANGHVAMRAVIEAAELAGDAVDSRFGSSVVLDGDWIFIGASGARSAAGAAIGRAWVGRISEPPGAACTAPEQCTQTHCVAGICCESACLDPCQSCREAETGEPDGVCTWRRQPSSECVMDAGTCPDCGSGASDAAQDADGEPAMATTPRPDLNCACRSGTQAVASLWPLVAGLPAIVWRRRRRIRRSRAHSLKREIR